MDNRTIKITNIEWDTDGEFIDDLPTEYIYEPDVDETIEEAEDIIADILSDEFGWCVCGFNLQEEWSQNYETESADHE
jgi:hypothetical protein